MIPADIRPGPGTYRSPRCRRPCVFTHRRGFVSLPLSSNSVPGYCLACSRRLKFFECPGARSSPARNRAASPHSFKEARREGSDERMQQARTSASETAAVQRIFNIATVTVGGLYLATHSVTVTTIGTAASTIVTCWSIWLERHQRAESRATRDLASASSQSWSATPSTSQYPGRLDATSDST